MTPRVAWRGIAICCALLSPVPGLAAAQDIKVTLLGTGTPMPAMNRFGPSTLVEAGGRRFLFDAGRGTGWLVAPGRNRALRVWGPAGTKKMMSHLAEAYEFDIGVRQSDDRASAEGALILAEDITAGIVFEKDGLTITAIEVDHAPVAPAFGYRIDYRGRSVVLSGDTRVSANLVRHAQGADLLIHEVVSPESILRNGQTAGQATSRIQHHTSAEQAGEVFARVKPRLAVYSHIGQPDATTDELITPARKAYAGPLKIGEDLMVITVGATVEVHRFLPASP